MEAVPAGADRAFAALGHPKRLEAFRLLLEAGDDGLSAGEIVARLGVLQQTGSTQLRILVNAGVVAFARSGRDCRYKIIPERVSECIAALTRTVGGKWAG